MSHGPEFVQSEQPALQLLKQMGYQYISGVDLSAERSDAGEVILVERLRASIARLNPLLDTANQQRAYERITQVLTPSLIETNQTIWAMLRGEEFRLKQAINGREIFIPVRFIDYTSANDNDFLAINQLRFLGRAFTAVPDIIIYVNGLPLGIIECKAGSASNAWDSAWNDLDAYQRNNEALFHYNQICVGIASWR